MYGSVLECKRRANLLIDSALRCWYGLCEVRLDLKPDFQKGMHFKQEKAYVH